MSSYTTALAWLVSKTGMSQNTWDSDEWRKVAQLVTEEDLQDANEKASLVVQKLLKLRLSSQRNAKTLKRVHKKIEEHYGNYFKAISDFIGFRVNCTVEEIAGKLCILQELKDCTIMIRKPSSNSNACASYMDNTGKYIDILQYVYVYFPDIGHITELQIGHVFASYTFKIDSEIRYGKKRIEELYKQGIFIDSRLPVDLWEIISTQYVRIIF